MDYPKLQRKCVGFSSLTVLPLLPHSPTPLVFLILRELINVEFISSNRYEICYVSENKNFAIHLDVPVL